LHIPACTDIHVIEFIRTNGINKGNKG
jgi:hypothetical protein